MRAYPGHVLCVVCLHVHVRLRVRVFACIGVRCVRMCVCDPCVRAMLSVCLPVSLSISLCWFVYLFAYLIVCWLYPEPNDRGAK